MSKGKSAEAPPRDRTTAISASGPSDFERCVSPDDTERSNLSVSSDEMAVMRADEHERDRLIVEIAADRRNIMSHRDLVHLGFDRHAIKRRVDRGFLTPVFRRAYRVGNAAPVPYSRETAAVLSFNMASSICARSSLVLWGICDADETLDVDVLVIAHNLHPRRGIRIHRAEAVDAQDLGVCERLNCTMPARALLEAAGETGGARMSDRDLEAAVDEALALNLVDRPGLLAVCARYPNHRGVKRLRALADPDRASEITKSEAEAAAARHLTRARAPASQTQYEIGSYKADRCWPELLLVCEIDGVQFHRDGKRMEEDEDRSRHMRHSGYEVVRFTRREVVHEPEYFLFWLGVEYGRRLVAAA